MTVTAFQLPGQPFFHQKHDTLMVENCSLSTLAKQYGTPLFVYSQGALQQALSHYQRSFVNRNARICYAVKANSNLSILRWFANQGCGFDIVSGGELARALKAGADTQKIIFSGVGKTRAEIRFALKQKIGCFNVESEEELQVINEEALALSVKAPISIRVNPNVDAKTHPYISTGLKGNKFGIAHEKAVAIYQKASRLDGMEIHGIDCHIGSQITQEAPYLEAMDRLIELIKIIEDQGIYLRHIDFGGGVGVQYRDEELFDLPTLWTKLFAKLDVNSLGQRQIMVEPGRSLVANSAVCLTRVIHCKHGEEKNFCIVDAGMNDMPRPSLYESYHAIAPVVLHPHTPALTYDVAGPICESGDWLGRDRTLAVQADDVLSMFSAGAYCMSMASNYNSRPRAAEVLIDGEKVTLIRQRETQEQLWSLET